MTTARDLLFSRLNNRRQPAPLPPAWHVHRQYDDLARQFTAALTAAQGEVLAADNLAHALEQLSTLLTHLNAQKIAVNPQPPLDTLEYAQRWPNYDWHIVGQSPENTRDFCTHADVGLTTSPVALAETGSVAIVNGVNASRYVPLLPPVHVVLLPTSRLTADLFTWAASHAGQPLPSAWVFVSGPSKSADIEQTLTVGVHGPKRFIVILYPE